MTTTEARVPPTGPTIDRGSYLGASQIGAVAGLSPWATALDVWAEIKGIHRVTETTAMRIGTYKERPILEHVYAPAEGVRLSYPGTIVCEHDRWRGATPDALARVNGDGAAVIDVQFKSVGRRTISKWGDPEEGEDGVPPEVLAQVHWEAGAIRDGLGFECNLAHVVTEYGNELRIYRVPIDDGFLRSLIDIGNRFWCRYILGDEMPVVEGDPDGVREILEAVYPKVLRDSLEEPPQEVVDLALQYGEAREKAKEANQRQKALGNRLIEACQDGKGFEGSGIKVTYGEQRGRPAWKTIAEALGATEEIIEAHRSAPVRVLRVTVKKEA